ncbi:MAG TPA: hypothetical protein VK303_04200 [Desulfobacteria bacterium]|nr:hypothetical protein [Desulfobacteria bacterium]
MRADGFTASMAAAWKVSHQQFLQRRHGERHPDHFVNSGTSGFLGQFLDRIRREQEFDGPRLDILQQFQQGNAARARELVFAEDQVEPTSCHRRDGFHRVLGGLHVASHDSEIRRERFPAPGILTDQEDVPHAQILVKILHVATIPAHYDGGLSAVTGILDISSYPFVKTERRGVDGLDLGICEKPGQIATELMGAVPHEYRIIDDLKESTLDQAMDRLIDIARIADGPRQGEAEPGEDRFV